MNREPSGMWLRLGAQNLAAADMLAAGSLLRPAATRYYYATYQAAHALVLTTELAHSLPRRGNWDHGPLINALYAALVGAMAMPAARAIHVRAKFVSALHARSIADYMPSVELDHILLGSARNAAQSIVRLATRRLGV